MGIKKAEAVEGGSDGSDSGGSCCWWPSEDRQQPVRYRGVCGGSLRGLRIPAEGDPPYGSNAHGTDMVTIPPEGELGYASVPKTEEREAREELADELMRFVREAFGETSQGNQGAEIGMETFRQEQMSRLARRFQAACQGAIRAISRRHQG